MHSLKYSKHETDTSLFGKVLKSKMLLYFSYNPDIVVGLEVIQIGICIIITTAETATLNQ